MRIIDQIKIREQFTPTENTIALYLVDNAKEVTDLSLSELAERLYVSKSSIIRFCKKLGFHGHKELCVRLAEELNTFTLDGKEINVSFPYEKDDDIRQIATKTYTILNASLVQTYQDLDVIKIASFAKAINNANMIYIYASDETSLQAAEFARKLRQLSYPIELTAMSGNSLKQAALQEHNSIALMIHYNEPSSLLDSARILNDRGIAMYTIGGPVNSTLYLLSKEWIKMEYYESEPKMVNIGSYTALMLILNVLYAMVFQLNYDQNRKVIIDADEQVKKYRFENLD